MSPAAPPAEPPAAEDRPRVPAVPASSLVLVRPGAGGEISVFTVRRAGEGRGVGLSLIHI